MICQSPRCPACTKRRAQLVIERRKIDGALASLRAAITDATKCAVRLQEVIDRLAIDEAAGSAETDADGRPQ